MAEEPAAVVVDELLGGEPSHALHEAAFDLPDVDRRIERSADVVKDIDPVDPELAGERVDGDLTAGRAIGEIEERPALRLVPVPMDLRADGT